MDESVESKLRYLMDNIESLHDQANIDDAESQLRIARKYYHEKDYEKAFFWYNKAMMNGHPDGMNGVGLCYYKGQGVEVNKEKGEYLLKQAIENGSTRAMCNLALFLNSPESGTLFQKAAQLGNADAQLEVARCYMYPERHESWEISDSKNTNEAFYWFLKSAMQGNRVAQYEIGLFYETGLDPCIRNTEKALLWYNKASSQGINQATFAIGRLYANGIDDLTPDFISAYKYYKQAADAGLGEAQYRTGLALFYGRGTSEDKFKAYEYLLKSATQGHSEAQLYIALLLVTGQGVEKDLELAKEWLNTKGLSPRIEDEVVEEKKYQLLKYLNSDLSHLSITECTPIDLAFAYIDSFGVVYSQDGKKLLRYTADDGYFDFTLEHPLALQQQTLIDYNIPDGVEIICDGAFEDCESIESINIPDSIRHIGERAFSRCANLCSVRLPSEISVLQSDTFNECFSLSNICLPDTLIKIKERALNGVVGLTSNSNRFVVKHGCLIDEYDEVLVQFIEDGRTYFRIPDEIRLVGAFAFRMCSLVSVYIPDSVEEIGESAFEKCYFLEKIDFCYYDNHVKEIGAGAFIGCERLETIVLPDGLEIIGAHSFCNCKNLRFVVLPNSLKSIETLAFENTSIHSITLPISLNNIGYNVFAESTLSHLDSKSPLFKVIDLTIFNSDCKKLLQYYGNSETYKVPDSVIEIGDFAFGYSWSLKTLIFPNSVKIIGTNILDQTYPNKIVIPERLASKLKESINEFLFNRIEIYDNI